MVRMESYPWRAKVKSRAKQDTNSRLAELAYKVASSRLGLRPVNRPRSSSQHNLWALVLDAPSLSTSKALKQIAGFRTDHIVVPNDSDALFPADASTHAVVLSGRTLGSVLAEQPPRATFTCIFFDFTVCLDGSWRPSQDLESLSDLVGDTSLKRVTDLPDMHACGSVPSSTPLEDIHALFSNSYIDAQGAVLGVTLAHVRDLQRKAKRGGSALGQWERLRLLIGTLASQHNLCAVQVPWREEQAAVATEFWVLGSPYDDGLHALLHDECARWV